MSEPAFDVSIVLNLHNESHYIRRTLRSLEEAVGFARRYNVTSELVAVLDRPDRVTKEWIGHYDFATFDGHQVCVVDHGDPAPSRAAGVFHARGRFISFSDADDLISFNALAAAFLKCAAAPANTVVVPQYLLAFGHDHHFWELFGTERISKLTFFNYNPYVYRLFARKSLLNKAKFTSTRASTPYGFEDWHLNCELVSLGCDFAIAENSIFFYRQRAGSRLETHRSAQKLIPPSELFKPTNYLKATGFDFNKPAGEELRPDWQQIKVKALEDNTVLELVKAANNIDPAIGYWQLVGGGFGSNVPENDTQGRRYHRACKLVGNHDYTDVVLLPFLTTGGADKYVLSVVNGLAQLDPTRRFLILTGQPIERHRWLDKLPEKATFLDLYRLCDGANEADIHLIALRLIQSCAQNALIHVKGSEFANGFISRYIEHLRYAGNKLVVYYFSDYVKPYRGVPLVEGFNFDFLSNIWHAAFALVSDHRRVLEELASRIDVPGPAMQTLFSVCSIPKDAAGTEGRIGARKKLLWASRLDWEKRPHILLGLGRALEQSGVDVQLDIFGTSVLGDFDVELFRSVGSLNYRGGYSDFREIDHNAYDGFLYTSSIDGLPNVVLEAMGAGLPVIAPDVGGIREAVSSETGYLIESTSNDERLIQRYVEAIKKLYDENTDVAGLSRNARQLIRERHSEEVYLRRLAEIFELPYGPVQGVAAAAAE